MFSLYFSKKGKSQDTLRDLFSRLKEASCTRKQNIFIPYSRVNNLVLLKFYNKGLIANFNYIVSTNCFLIILKYDFSGNGLLNNLKWVSLISRRVYFKNEFLYKLDQKNVYLFFNEKGLFFLDELYKTRSGGELLCEIIC